MSILNMIRKTTEILGFEHLHFNSYAVPFAAAAAFILFIGIYVLIYGASLRQRRVFFGLSLSYFIWLTGTSLAYSMESLDKVLFYAYFTYAGVSLIPVMTYWYASVWLGQEKKNRGLIILGFLLAVLFETVIIGTDWIVYDMKRFFWGYHTQLTVAGGVSYLIFFQSYWVLFFFTLYKAHKTETSPLRKNQIRLVAIAFLIALLGCSDFLPCYGFEIFPVGGLTMAAACFALGYTIIRYKLLDIETVIHKTLMWLLASSILGAPILLFYYYFKEWLYRLPDGGFIAVIAASVIAGIFYVRNFQPLIDHFFQRRRRDLRRAMEQFTDALVHLRTLEEVTAHILSTVQNVFYAGHVSILIRNEKDNAFDCFQQTAGERVCARFPAQQPFLVWLEKNDRIVFEEYLTADPALAGIVEEAKKYFEEVDAVLALPLIANQQLIGVLNIGKKGNLRRYRPAEIDFLSELRRSSAIAVSNALHIIAMQENLRRWNEELEKKVDERTRQLQQTQAQLLQAEKLATIGTLAGGVAHEINNPLTAVLTNAQILKMTASEEDRESIELIEEGAKRCQIIIQKLMKYARKSPVEILNERVDLRKAIENTAAMLAYQFKQENVELRLDLQPQPLIEGVANELEQLFTNLFLNSRDAIKAVDRAGLIEVRMSRKEGMIEVQVKDNGEGIKKEHLSKIFDPFFTTKDVGRGTGLGLAVSLGIIKKHRGEVHIETAAGTGTTFVLSFPINGEAAGVAPAP